MIKASFKKYTLNFKQASGTSRGVLRTKETYFLSIINGEKNGIGECGLFRGLSCDDRADYEDKLRWLCENINLPEELLLFELKEFPSIQFGLEQVFLSLKSSNKFELFPSEFTKGNIGIPINGLIWMGNKEFMYQQIKNKLQSGFTTIKMKIGAIDFNTELSLLKSIRTEFSANEIELRVDANGAFHPNDALDRLNQLTEYNIHSIEQPIKQGQLQEMAQLCEVTPIPIALDEELIGIVDLENKEKLLDVIKPQYIILKPSLVGGILGSKDWIWASEERGIDWWITSALESNIGLNAIAQFAYDLKVRLPQGLGTGGLFTNNFDSPLEVKDGQLKYNRNKNWNVNII